MADILQHLPELAALAYALVCLLFALRALVARVAEPGLALWPSTARFVAACAVLFACCYCAGAIIDRIAG